MDGSFFSLSIIDDDISMVIDCRDMDRYIICIMSSLFFLVTLCVTSQIKTLMHLCMYMYMCVGSQKALSTTLKAVGSYLESEKGLWDLVSI